MAPGAKPPKHVVVAGRYLDHGCSPGGAENMAITSASVI